MATTLAEVLRRFGPEYICTHALSTRQARAWRAIVACRTPALGGEQWRCDDCGAEAWRWHSCRTRGGAPFPQSRHCPQCQTQARDAWRTARLAELLTVPYCHLAFTLPHEINALAGAHPRWVYDTLMQSAAQTLTEFAANPRWLGGAAAFTLVLHTWTQDLTLHLHVHALMACGALGVGPDGQACWLKPRRGERFLFPVHALSRVFRGKFMQALEHAERAAELPREPADSAQARQQRHQALRRHDWVVYAKTPLAGPAAVLDYLARYTHRTAIGNERLQGIQGEQVRFKVRANDKAGPGGPHGKTSKVLDGVEFITRLLRHVLPSGFKRIRHYGLLAPAHKTERMAAARRLLAMPQANPVATEDARAFMQRVAGLDVRRCKHCGTGRWVVVACVACVAAQRRFAGEAEVACRGPP